MFVSMFSSSQEKECIFISTHANDKTSSSDIGGSLDIIDEACDNVLQNDRVTHYFEYAEPVAF